MRTTPHSRLTGWGSKPSRYTAQSPLLTEEPSGFFTQYSELPSSAQDFFDVPLAYKEPASEFLDVTLAREEYCLGVLPDPDRRCEFYFIVSLTIKNISI